MSGCYWPGCETPALEDGQPDADGWHCREHARAARVRVAEREIKEMRQRARALEAVLGMVYDEIARQQVIVDSEGAVACTWRGLPEASVQ